MEPQDFDILGTNALLKSQNGYDPIKALEPEYKRYAPTRSENCEPTKITIDTSNIATEAMPKEEPKDDKISFCGCRISKNWGIAGLITALAIYTIGCVTLFVLGMTICFPCIWALITILGVSWIAASIAQSCENDMN